jgi:HAD superfamily hydrolase (TIGR01450 family)
VLPPVVAIDLDGVIWRASAPIPGSAEAVARLQAAVPVVVFVTNNAYPDLAGHEAKLASMGIAAAGAVISSPAAAASLLGPGERVLVAGGAGVAEAVRAVGAVPVDYKELAAGADAVDAVVAGFHQGFDYERMRIASDAVRGGARFIATNDDPTYVTEHGLVPGNGALIASVAVASGVEPTIAGKPHPPIVELVRRRFGDRGLVVGDRPDTDGGFAEALGWDFGLVLSGITSVADLPVVPEPVAVADDLAALVEALLDPVA